MSAAKLGYFLSSCLLRSVLAWAVLGTCMGGVRAAWAADGERSRTLIDADWRFNRGDPQGGAVNLLYEDRVARGGRGPASPAPGAAAGGVKAWILPTGNAFLKSFDLGIAALVAALEIGKPGIRLLELREDERHLGAPIGQQAGQALADDLNR